MTISEAAASEFVKNIFHVMTSSWWRGCICFLFARKSPGFLMSGCRSSSRLQCQWKRSAKSGRKRKSERNELILGKKCNFCNIRSAVAPKSNKVMAEVGMGPCYHLCMSLKKRELGDGEMKETSCRASSDASITGARRCKRRDRQPGTSGYIRSSKNSRNSETLSHPDDDSSCFLTSSSPSSPSSSSATSSPSPPSATASSCSSCSSSSCCKLYFLFQLLTLISFMLIIAKSPLGSYQLFFLFTESAAFLFSL